MIVFGSLNTTGYIYLRQTSANGTVAPIDLTGMTLEVRFWDVGRSGSSSSDYGSPSVSETPLATIAQADDEEGGIVVDSETNGQVHVVINSAASIQIRDNSVLSPSTARRRLTMEIWRIDDGAESRLYRETVWAEG